MGAGANALRGVRGSPEDRANSAKSKAIDRALSKDYSDNKHKFKILLLGGSECGKTTIFKQMRILHLNGFSRDDEVAYRSVIHNNSLDAMTQLLLAGRNMNLHHDFSVEEDINRFEDYKKKLLDREDLVIPVVIGRCIDRIWTSPSMQRCYEYRFTYQLLDSCKYFLDNIIRLTEDFYIPSAQDIIQCRLRTTSINEIQFKYKQLEFKMVDVGGQRSERRKWIHCFDNVDMVLFIAAMSDYDQSDPEDSRFNRMKQSYEIFKAIVRSDIFRNASIVLFLNKNDIFRQKLKTSPLQNCFSTYKGDGSPEDAEEFVKKQFRRCIQERHKFSCFVTTATDTNNIEHVFKSAVSHIVTENLKSTGLEE